MALSGMARPRASLMYALSAFMTLPLVLDAVDCCADEKTFSAGAATTPAVNASPAHSKRSRRVIAGAANFFDFLDLDFMRLAFCVLEFLSCTGPSFTKTG